MYTCMYIYLFIYINTPTWRPYRSSRAPRFPASGLGIWRRGTGRPMYIYKYIRTPISIQIFRSLYIIYRLSTKHIHAASGGV